MTTTGEITYGQGYAMKVLMSKYRLAVLAGVLAVGNITALQAATLNVMQNEAPRSMDPGDQTATFTDTVLKPMYEGLVDLSPITKSPRAGHGLAGERGRQGLDLHAAQERHLP